MASQKRRRDGVASNVAVAVRLRPFNNQEKKLGTANAQSLTVEKVAYVICNGCFCWDMKKFSLGYSFFACKTRKSTRYLFLIPMASKFMTSHSTMFLILAPRDRIARRKKLCGMRWGRQPCNRRGKASTFPCTIFSFPFLSFPFPFPSPFLPFPFLISFVVSVSCQRFAYGQTGSGKSFTMMGGSTSEDKGVIPRLADHIFDHISKEPAQNADGSSTTFSVTCSMLEIYNEKVRDLLVQPKERKDLKVKEDPNRGAFADGLSIENVDSRAMVHNLLEKGNKARTIASTLMNSTSSRAHTIFQMKVV
jgi:hypothetical protein